MNKMKTKVGILTLNGYNNYGNRLQNYALETVVISLGCEVETILVDRKSTQSISERLNRISTIKEVFEKIARRIKMHFNRKYIIKRESSFIDFSRKYIKETNYKLSIESIPKDFSSKYDFFITGSDQVWNPNNLHGTSFFFLTFAEKEKRIAYAPSFGISKIKEIDFANYKKWLLDMNRLSVRESEGATIVEELTGRKAAVLVDPTLLLSKEHWLSISKESHHKPTGKYLLTYFLGDIPEKNEKQIKKIAESYKLIIINLGDIRERNTYVAGPSEFIDFVNNCSVFCTDSFHGAVFSILLEKPFIIYERIGTDSMYSRINTLLDKFDLNYRKSQNVSYDQVFKIDFSHLPKKLEFERKKSLTYLKEALKIQDEN